MEITRNTKTKEAKEYWARLDRAIEENDRKALLSNVSVSINHNWVWVKLNQVGLEILNEEKPIQPVVHIEPETGFHRFQFWELLDIFGPGALMRHTGPFVDGEIFLNKPHP